MVPNLCDIRNVLNGRFSGIIILAKRIPIHKLSASFYTNSAV